MFSGGVNKTMSHDANMQRNCLPAVASLDKKENNWVFITPWSTVRSEDHILKRCI